MSKIGKQPINIPKGVEVKLQDDKVMISKDGNKLVVDVLDGVTVEVKDDTVVCSISSDKKQTKSNWGTLRSLLYNAIEGVTKGFEKKLLLKGVGYRIEKKGKGLSLSLGFSHSVEYESPEGIELEVPDRNTLLVKGIDKALVGQVAAEIRSFRPVEPYKGKGFRYSDEVVRRKEGKKAVATEI